MVASRTWRPLAVDWSTTDRLSSVHGEREAYMTADPGQELVVDQETAVRTLGAAVERMVSTQREAVSAAARLCAGALMADGILQAFGTGHSQSFAMEIAG